MKFDEISKGDALVNRYSHEFAVVAKRDEHGFAAFYWRTGDYVTYMPHEAWRFDPASPAKRRPERPAPIDPSIEEEAENAKIDKQLERIWSGDPDADAEKAKAEDLEYLEAKGWTVSIDPVFGASFKAIAEPLVDHPAVTKHGYGTTSAELASFTESLCSLAANRVKGTGAEQYDLGGRQKFEDMTAEQLATELTEECADVINYVAMLLIKMLSAIRARQGWQ